MSERASDADRDEYEVERLHINVVSLYSQATLSNLLQPAVAEGVVEICVA